MLTREQVNAYQWSRQGFDETSGMDGGWSARQIGFYDGAAPTCYLAALARDPAFRFADLDHAPYQDRSLVRMRAMRNTLFMLPEKWVSFTYQATREAAMYAFQKLVEGMGIFQDNDQAISSEVLMALAGESLTAGELKKAIPFPTAAARDAFSFILSLICAEGRLVRAREMAMQSCRPPPRWGRPAMAASARR